MRIEARASAKICWPVGACKVTREGGIHVMAYHPTKYQHVSDAAEMVIMSCILWSPKCKHSSAKYVRHVYARAQLNKHYNGAYSSMALALLLSCSGAAASFICLLYSWQRTPAKCRPCVSSMPKPIEKRPYINEAICPAKAPNRSAASKNQAASRNNFSCSARSQ